MLEQLHREEAHTRVEIGKLQKRLNELHSQFDSSYAKVNEIAALLKTKKAELKSVNERLKDTHRRHSRISSEITHHSLKEVKVCIKRAKEHLEKGLVVKARDEYERIRRFYIHLTSKEKKRIYKDVARIKDRLTYHF